MLSWTPEDWNRRAAPAAQVTCATCNGNGWIGGPSYREPDEGGIECPDCNGVSDHCAPAAHGAVPIRDDEVTESPAATDNAYTLTRMRAAGWSNERLLRSGWAVAKTAAAPAVVVDEADKLTIEVYWPGDGNDAFVCAAFGKITGGMIGEIESDLAENPPAEFEENGAGAYTYSVSRFEGEYAEYGQCVWPPGWELSLVSFEALREGDDALAAALGQEVGRG